MAKRRELDSMRIRLGDRDRIQNILDAVMKIAKGDYSVQIGLSSQDDELDTLAV